MLNEIIPSRFSSSSSSSSSLKSSFAEPPLVLDMIELALPEDVCLLLVLPAPRRGTWELLPCLTDAVAAAAAAAAAAAGPAGISAVSFLFLMRIRYRS
jgi:hypothetical protein